MNKLKENLVAEYKSDVTAAIMACRDMPNKEAQALAEKVLSGHFDLSRSGRAAAKVKGVFSSIIDFQRESFTLQTIEVLIAVAFLAFAFITLLPKIPLPEKAKDIVIVSETERFEDAWATERTCIGKRVCIDEAVMSAYNRRLDELENGKTTVLVDSTTGNKYIIARDNYVYTIEIE